jgi:hypothetical protein
VAGSEALAGDGDTACALTHLWWRGDRMPVVDPLARDQAKLEEGRERLPAGGAEIVIPGHGAPSRLG